MAFSDFRDDKSRLDNWREYLNEAEDPYGYREDMEQWEREQYYAEEHATAAAKEEKYVAEHDKIEELVDGVRSETLYIYYDWVDPRGDEDRSSWHEDRSWVFQAIISVPVPNEMRTKELDWRAEHAIEKEFERSADANVDLTSEGRLPKPDFNAQHLNHGELQISWAVYGIEKLEGFIKDVEQMDNYFGDPSVRAKLFAPMRKQAELPLSEEKQRKFSDFKEDKSRLDNWRGFLNEGHDC